jgi:hypothetical protein
MVMRLGHFKEQNRNTWEVLNVTGEGWRRSVGLMM